MPSWQGAKPDDTCSVPNCDSGYRSCATVYSLFRAPKEIERLQQWAYNIKRGDKEFDEESVVCEKHFESHFIKRSFKTVIRRNDPAAVFACPVRSLPARHPAKQRHRGTCPHCSEPFEENECQAIKIPPKKASSLKAHCWNHTQGCRFVDVLPAVLQHYERDCNYHSTPCLSCGESVLHRDLPRHRSDCCHQELSENWEEEIGQGDTAGGDSAFAGRGDTAGGDWAFAGQGDTAGGNWAFAGQGDTTGGDWDTAGGDWAFAEPSEPEPAVDDAALSALQSQMDELARELCELGQALQNASGTLTDFELGLDNNLSEELENHSDVSDESGDANEERVHGASQSDSGFGGHESSYSRRVGPGSTETAVEQTGDSANAEAVEPALPWALEKRHILRKLEVAANHSLHYLQSIHSQSPLHEAAMAYCKLIPLAPHETIDDKLCPIPRCPPIQRHAIYRFTTKGVDKLLNPGVYDLKISGAATRWHRREIYFTVVIASRKSEGSLEVFIRWGQTLDAERQPPQVRKVMLVHRIHTENCPMEKVQNLPVDAVFLPGFHDRFKKGIVDLKDKDDFMQDGELKIEVYIVD
ncbi:hypothetical protein HPB50_025852 [Hyalomma asiaticum]|uniref:Uncharacterized protein n=1 Tax=Hyalomma asiaticum TaxID=266040 RepID=A0ACB7TRI6_HYAAI|nr:hypothetical protein HPB50_025852 [Hyalomma asiaticum]